MVKYKNWLELGRTRSWILWALFFSLFFPDFWCEAFCQPRSPIFESYIELVQVPVPVSLSVYVKGIPFRICYSCLFITLLIWKHVFGTKAIVPAPSIPPIWNLSACSMNIRKTSFLEYKKKLKLWKRAPIIILVVVRVSSWIVNWKWRLILRKLTW